MPRISPNCQIISPRMVESRRTDLSFLSIVVPFVNHLYFGRHSLDCRAYPYRRREAVLRLAPLGDYLLDADGGIASRGGRHEIRARRGRCGREDRSARRSRRWIKYAGTRKSTGTRRTDDGDGGCGGGGEQHTHSEATSLLFKTNSVASVEEWLRGTTSWGGGSKDIWRDRFRYPVPVAIFIRRDRTELYMEEGSRRESERGDESTLKRYIVVSARV
ncbi:hypothetical protein ALC62_05645 [Cyphomyrmex costatus]|uniref:Uncharacterized protein n=1 Tax=Cyphomyrmex costatus TaxID=456900 RepID=A0A195CS03_9HYME|nr:hypothetical protein ALC62_05645 [Cyphomyrmex costatus]